MKQYVLLVQDSEYTADDSCAKCIFCGKHKDDGEQTCRLSDTNNKLEEMGLERCGMAGVITVEDHYRE